VVRPPTNEETRLVNALLNRLRPSNDLRYWFVWLYGPFVTELPRRLGRNAALDNAVLATLTIHTEACTRTAEANPQASAMAAYFHAVRALRRVLDDPIEALSLETLTTVMLLVIAHARIDGPFASFWSPHGKGMLQLLRLRSQNFRGLGHRVHQFEKFYAGDRDEYEDVLMSMLQMSVLLQSFANPEVVLTSNEYHLLKNGIPGNTYTARGLRSLLVLSELYSEARAGGSVDERVERLHKAVEVIVSEHFARLNDIGQHHPDTAIRLRGIYTRAYGMAISTSGLTTCLRRALQPDDQKTQADAVVCVQRVISSQAIAERFLPLGASWLGWALMIAWCAAKGLPERLSCEAALEDYLRASQGPRAVLRADLLKMLEERLWLV
jgi:hypothetical protein